jgi:hypothetical protein
VSKTVLEKLQSNLKIMLHFSWRCTSFKKVIRSIFQAGITAAPVRAVAAVKNFSPSVPNLSNINLPSLPSIPTSIKELKTALPNFNKKF